EADVVVYAVQGEVQGPHLEDDKPPPDERVQKAGVPVPWPDDTRIAEEVGEQADNALDGLGEAVHPLRAGEPAEANGDGPEEEGEEADEEGVEEDVAGKVSRWRGWRHSFLRSKRAHDTGGPNGGSNGSGRLSV